MSIGRNIYEILQFPESNIWKFERSLIVCAKTIIDFLQSAFLSLLVFLISIKSSFGKLT